MENSIDNLMNGKAAPTKEQLFFITAYVRLHDEMKDLDRQVQEKRESIRILLSNPNVSTSEVETLENEINSLAVRIHRKVNELQTLRIEEEKVFNESS